MNILQSALDNWPEDEARAIADYWKDPESREGYGEKDWLDNVFRDCVRMEKFFMQESDGAELVKRFRVKISKLLELPENFF